MYTCRNCSNCLTCQVHLFPETIPIIPVRLRHEVVIMDTVCINSVYIYKHIYVLHMYTIVYDEISTYVRAHGYHENLKGEPK